VRKILERIRKISRSQGHRTCASKFAGCETGCESPAEDLRVLFDGQQGAIADS
jgi:hypothetical protein